MDMLLLTGHRRIFGYTATYPRILASATLGATYSCIVTVCRIGDTLTGKICTYIIIVAFMVRICAGECKIKKWIKYIAGFYSTAFLVGGAGHMFLYYTEPGYLVVSVVQDNRWLVMGLALGLVLIGFMGESVKAAGMYAAKTFKVALVIGGEKIMLQGFFDTGNVLAHPISKKPVSIVELAKVESVLNKYSDYHKLKMHYIPFRSMGCESGVMQVITADEMYIYTDKEVVDQKEPLIGLAGQQLSQDGAYDMLLNSRVFEI